MLLTEHYEESILELALQDAVYNDCIRGGQEAIAAYENYLEKFKSSTLTESNDNAFDDIITEDFYSNLNSYSGVIYEFLGVKYNSNMKTGRMYLNHKSAASKTQAPLKQYKINPVETKPTETKPTETKPVTGSWSTPSKVTRKVTPDTSTNLTAKPFSTPVASPTKSAIDISLPASMTAKKNDMRDWMRAAPGRASSAIKSGIEKAKGWFTKTKQKLTPTVTAAVASKKIDQNEELSAQAAASRAKVKSERDNADKKEKETKNLRQMMYT